MNRKRYLSRQDLLHGAEAASSRQQSSLEALVVDVNGVELVSQLVQLSGLHGGRGAHLVDVLHTARTHTETHAHGNTRTCTRKHTHTRKQTHRVIVRTHP